MSKSLDPRPVERDPLDGIIVLASGGKNNSQNGGQSGEPITVLWPPPANGIIPSPPSTAVDECPPLVSSEDEEETEWARNNDELVKRWMTLAKKKNRLKQEVEKMAKKKNLLEEEVEKIEVQGVGLFLLGMTTCAPTVWVSALMMAGVFDVDERARMVNVEALDDKLLLLSEVAEEIFRRNKHIFLPGHRRAMRAVLDMIDDIEKNGVSAEVIEVQRSLQIAMDCSFFNEEWQELKQTAKVQKYIKEYTRGDKQPPLFMLLFFYKLVHHHVSYFGSHKGTKADDIIRIIHHSNSFNYRTAKMEGNRYFKEKDYTEAIKMYSVSMIKDYGNPILYGNRAQCYIFIQEYWKAYCDCRRAIFLNPMWFKGYYRGAEACLHMNRLDEALKLNKKAQNYCSQSDEGLQMDILKQKQKIIAALKARGGSDVDMEDYAAMESQVEAALARQNPQKGKMDFPPRDSSQKSAAQGNPNNNSRDKLKSKTESESSRGSHPPRPQEMTSVEKFIQYVREALEAYNVQNPVRAAAKYESALDLYAKSTVVKTHVSDEEFTVLRYSFGINAVSQDGLKMMIREGHRMLQALYQERSSHRTFPLVIYGLGTALVALYRFPEAMKVVNVPITKAMKRGWKEVCWPQSKQTIEESKRDVFLRELTRLKELCRFPPPPDAVCFEHVDHTESRSIYKDSPTFEVQGLVKLSCYEKCIFTFHYATCWKEYRGRFSADKISDKDVVDKPCPTPDCGSFISCILIQKPDKRPVVLKSESRPIKPRGNNKVGRMSLSNPDKIARRVERKELKRQKRAEARQVAGQQSSPPQSSPEKEAGSLHGVWKAADTPARSGAETATVMPSANTMVILQKEEEKDDIKYNPFHNKTRTNKKKKEKVNRNRLNLEVNFTDDAERERVGERDALDEDQEVDLQWSKPPRMALLPAPALDLFAVPPHLKEKVVFEPFSKIVANLPSRNPIHSQREDEIRHTVIEFLADFLRETGPQHIEGPSMHQTLQDFPEESSRVIEQYGGIRSFLAKHSHFAVVGDYAGVREDQEKVWHMADGLYDPPPNSLSTNPSYPYRADRPLIGGDSGAIERTLDGARPVYSQTLNGHAGSGDRTSPSFVGPGKVVAETEMTLPRCDFGLNPTAPEFQPGQLQIQGRLGVNGFDTDDNADWSRRPSSSDGASSAQRSERLDALDTFTSGIDDIDDDETFQEWNRIDEGDINPSASGSYADLDDLTAGQVAAGQDGLSRRSSRSDLSQTSDQSTSAAFRAASPSSSVSSHKTTSTRDLGSPFSLRDTSSPALLSHMARAGDVSRKTGSPISSSASVSSTSFVTTDRGSSELGLGFISDMAALTQPAAVYSSSAEFDSVGPPETNWNSLNVHGVPRPLKPLAPVTGAWLCAGGVSVSMGSARTPAEGAGAPMGSASVGTSALSQSTSSTFVKSTASPSALRSSSSASALAGGFSMSSYSFPVASSLTWGMAASVPTSNAWATNTFPSAVWPDKDVVNSIPPFPTAAFFSSSSSSSSTALPHLPSSSSSSNHATLHSSTSLRQPSPFRTTWSDAKNWSDVNSSCWSATPLVSEEPAMAKVVDSATQASVEVRSVEVSTEMSERDVQSLLMLQHKLDEVYQQLHHLHLVNERLQQENRKKEEEKQVALGEAEELRKDLSKTIHQMDNLDMEFQRSKEERAEREQQFHDDFRSLQERNNLRAMETAGLWQKLSALEEKAMLEQNRAIQAEVRVIQEMMQNFKMKLESKISEAELNRQHCMRLARRWQETHPGQPLPEQYKEYMAYYQQLHDTWTNKMEDILAQLSEQKEQILGGWLLADLAAITNLLPQLPQPPKGFMMGPNGRPLAPFMSLSENARQHADPHPALPAPESGQEPPAPAAMATGAVPPRPLGPPGLSMPRPPTPLRPPLRPPGMLLPGQPSTAAPAGAVTQVSNAGEVAVNPVNAAPPPLRPIRTSGTPTVSKLQPAVAAEPAKSTTPPPLRPISTGKSLPGASQPRMATPPPLTAVPSQLPASLKAEAQAPDASRPPSSFEKLVSLLQKTFPTCDREDFHRAIQELRRAHNGTLTGLSLEFILRHLTQMLIARGMKPHNTALSANGNSNNSNSNNNNSIISEGRRTAPPPGISAAWNVEGLADDDQFVEELDPCAICCEELSSGPVQVLECGHRYHDQCIRTWFRQQTTCPECRTYTPLLDDFPTLK